MWLKLSYNALYGMMGCLALIFNNSEKAGRKVTEEFIAKNIDKEDIK